MGSVSCLTMTPLQLLHEELGVKAAKTAAARCPGSGQYAAANLAAGRQLRHRACPSCGGLYGHNGGKIVNHKAPKS